MAGFEGAEANFWGNFWSDFWGDFEGSWSDFLNYFWANLGNYTAILGGFRGHQSQLLGESGNFGEVLGAILW